MPKLFDFDARNRSFIDRVSGVVPTNTDSVAFARTSKGFAIRCDGTQIGLEYPTLPACIDLTVVSWFSLRSGGPDPVTIVGSQEDAFLIWANSTTNTVRGYVNTSAGWKEVESSYSWDWFTQQNIVQLVITYDQTNITMHINGIWDVNTPETSPLDWSTEKMRVGSRIAPAKNHIGDVVKFGVYNHIWTPAEIAEDYQRLRHSSPTSTPTVIRHKIPVDPTGSVLTHDYQRWNGGIVPDLSGNGHIGQPIGFVDTTTDGARFDGTSYLDCGFSGGITGNLSIEALVRKTDIVGNEGIINKGTAVLLGINYYLGFAIDELQYIISDGVSGQSISTTTLNAIANEWYYVVLTVDGSFITSYANGVEILQTAQTVTPTANANDLFIGRMTAVTNPLDGTIKFVKVSPFALTEPQIVANWNKIARLTNLNIMGSNLLPDNKVVGVGGYIDA